MSKPLTPKQAPLSVEMVAIGRLKAHPGNPRIHPERSIAAVAKSMEAFGWTNPVLVDADGRILAGHTRVKAAQSQGMTEVPVIRLPLKGAKADAYLIADNQTATLSEWDFSLLSGLLSELDGNGFDATLTGFDDKELADLLAPPGGLLEGTDADDVPDVPKTPLTKLGDLITLGRHRLVCGDSTRAEDVARLMGGKRAGLVFTDPPYGVDYDGGTVKREKLQGDDTTALYDPACLMAAEYSEPDAALYLWHAGVKGTAAAAAAAAAAAGYVIRCELVWNKNQAQFGALSAQYKQKHESCYYCHKKGKAPRWFGPTNEVTVWDCDRASKNEYHPTQKPVALAERAMANSSKVGDVVLDLFGGSGSTLVACEVAKRDARLIEIDPAYCDVIVTRWENATGQKAVRP